MDEGTRDFIIAVACFVFVVALVIIVCLCFRRKQKERRSGIFNKQFDGSTDSGTYRKSAEILPVIGIATDHPSTSSSRLDFSTDGKTADTESHTSRQESDNNSHVIGPSRDSDYRTSNTNSPKISTSSSPILTDRDDSEADSDLQRPDGAINRKGQPSIMRRNLGLSIPTSELDQVPEMPQYSVFRNSAQSKSNPRASTGSRPDSQDEQTCTTSTDRHSGSRQRTPSSDTRSSSIGSSTNLRHSSSGSRSGSREVSDPEVVERRSKSETDYKDNRGSKMILDLSSSLPRPGSDNLPDVIVPSYTHLTPSTSGSRTELRSSTGSPSDKDDSRSTMSFKISMDLDKAFPLTNDKHRYVNTSYAISDHSDSESS